MSLVATSCSSEWNILTHFSSELCTSEIGQRKSSYAGGIISVSPPRFPARSLHAHTRTTLLVDDHPFRLDDTHATQDRVVFADFEGPMRPHLGLRIANRSTSAAKHSICPASRSSAPTLLAPDRPQIRHIPTRRQPRPQAPTRRRNSWRQICSISFHLSLTASFSPPPTFKT